MWTLGRILIYPIKGLPGIEVPATELLAAGNLRHDRVFALMDETGRFINGKRTADIHRIRAEFHLANWSVTLGQECSAATTTFRLDETPRLSAWFSDFFKMPTTLVHRPEGGFPDDTEANGPTIVSAGTLQAVSEWFPGLGIDEVRRRFRANLELTDNRPFAEDALFGETERPVPFHIGQAQLLGSNPCQRCVVPTRDSLTGEVRSGFQREFSRQREATLPAWTHQSRFNHFYRLAVNTIVRANRNQEIRVGDAVTLDP